MKQKIFIVILMMFAVLAQAVELDASLNLAGHQRYGFTINGIVGEVVIGAGTKVKKGDLLAKLDRQPFNYKVRQYQAAVKKYEPLVLDAKVEFDQATELFERTVLSEVELQKIEGNYKTVIAEQEVEKAKLQMAKWELRQASLKSRIDGFVTFSSVFPGMVISEENKSSAYIELVSAALASATAWLSTEQRLELKSGSDLSVEIDGQVIQARVQSVAMQPDKNNLYQLVAVFKYAKVIEPGRKIKLRF